jgi:site-specific DNA-cytosine methylase
VLLQNNHYLGAPQHRERMLFVAHLHPLVFPPLVLDTPKAGKVLATKGIDKKGQKLSAKHPGYELMWEVSRSLNYRNFNVLYHKNLTAAQQAQIKAIPGFTVKSIHPERHAPVLNDRVVHPHEPRWLTLHELQVLSGIPLDWKHSGSYGSSALEMSRTVLPPVGKWIATAVRGGLKMKRARSTYRVIDARKGVFQEEVLR